MWNTKCINCGQDAYVGLFGHISDCSNTKCTYHVPPLAVQPSDPDPGILNDPGTTIVVSPTSNLQPANAPAVKHYFQQIDDQKRVACSVAAFLKHFSNINAKSGFFTAYSFKDFILAGGAPRNWWMGMPAKDLDFFIANDKFYEDDLRDELKKIFPNDFVSLKKVSPSTYGFETFDILLTDSQSTTPLINNIQLINFGRYYDGDPKDVMNTFDFDINKIYCKFDASNYLTIETTQEFLNEVANKTLSFNLSTMVANRQYSSLAKVPTRTRKFQSLFPDHTLVIK